MSTAIYDENGDVNIKNPLVMKTAGTFVTHPLELSKVLIQPPSHEYDQSLRARYLDKLTMKYDLSVKM